MLSRRIHIMGKVIAQLNLNNFSNELPFKILNALKIKIRIVSNLYVIA